MTITLIHLYDPWPHFHRKAYSFEYECQQQITQISKILNPVAHDFKTAVQLISQRS